MTPKQWQKSLSFCITVLWGVRHKMLNYIVVFERFVLWKGITVPSELNWFFLFLSTAKILGSSCVYWWNNFATHRLQLRMTSRENQWSLIFVLDCSSSSFRINSALRRSQISGDQANCVVQSLWENHLEMKVLVAMISPDLYRYHKANASSEKWWENLFNSINEVGDFIAARKQPSKQPRLWWISVTRFWRQKGKQETDNILQCRPFPTKACCVGQRTLHLYSGDRSTGYSILQSETGEIIITSERSERVMMNFSYLMMSNWITHLYTNNGWM